MVERCGVRRERDSSTTDDGIGGVSGVSVGGSAP
jgi:hypothetical protein